jgi:transposase
MSKARVAVLHIVSGQLSVTAAAKTYGFSRQHLHRLLKRYREGGLQAVDARSRRPGSNPRAVSDEIITAIVGLREQLTADGLDAGPLTLHGTCDTPACRCPRHPRSGASCTTTA